MILDLIIVLVIALFTFVGYKRGLVKTAINILSFFVALFISMMLYKTVGNMIIDNTQIDEKIESTITSKIITEEIQEKYEILPDALVLEGENKINEISKAVSQKCIYMGTFAILFVLLKIILIFVRVLADIITNLPIIKQFDKAGGTIYGLVKGFLIVTLIFAVVTLISPMLDVKYIHIISESIIGSFMYNHNLLIGIIK